MSEKLNIPAAVINLVDVMKKIPVVLLATVFLGTATVGAAESSGLDLRAANLSFATSASEVLTPQAIERQSRIVRTASPAPPVRIEAEGPAWTAGQVWLLGMATAIACNAFVSHCAVSSAPIPVAPPVGELWRIEACKAENSCPPFLYPLR